MRLAGKGVVITGGGSGIGRALAIGFCADGATVVSIGRSEADLARTAQDCGPGRMHFVVGDILRSQDLERLFGEAHRHCGKVDVLVNNAAAYPKHGFLESSHEDWVRAFETNTTALVYCCRLALPGMLERGYGRIINLGTLAWLGPIPKSTAYSSSKAAVMAFTRALATEIDRSRYPDVLVNELLPGIVRTRMSEQGIDPALVYPHARHLVELPPGGPTGRTFLQSALYVENPGLRARLRRLLSRATLGWFPAP